ncbi:MAG: hypothetical protein HY556_00285 [Euryarchaeota archaeon]|nr:hypothetical protein [Euryarchaeota archaeon]
MAERGNCMNRSTKVLVEFGIMSIAFFVFSGSASADGSQNIQDNATAAGDQTVANVEAFNRSATENVSGLSTVGVNGLSTGDAGPAIQYAQAIVEAGNDSGLAQIAIIQNFSNSVLANVPETPVPNVNGSSLLFNGWAFLNTTTDTTSALGQSAQNAACNRPADAVAAGVNTTDPASSTPFESCRNGSVGRNAMSLAQDRVGGGETQLARHQDTSCDASRALVPMAGAFVSLTEQLTGFDLTP